MLGTTNLTSCFFIHYSTFNLLINAQLTFEFEAQNLEVTCCMSDVMFTRVASNVQVVARSGVPQFQMTCLITGVIRLNFQVE